MQVASAVRKSGTEEQQPEAPSGPQVVLNKFFAYVHVLIEVRACETQFCTYTRLGKPTRACRCQPLVAAEQGYSTSVSMDLSRLTNKRQVSGAI